MLQSIRNVFQGPPVSETEAAEKRPPQPTKERPRDGSKPKSSRRPQQKHSPRGGKPQSDQKNDTKPKNKPESVKTGDGKPRREQDSSTPRRRSKAPKPKWDPASFVVPEVEGKTRFHDLGLPEEIMHAISDLGFEYCTPVQAEVLPYTLQGKDASGRAQTGTGKTAAFLLTMINHMLKNPITEKRSVGTPRALIIAPTRELVMQIAKDARELTKYARLNIMAVFGGMGHKRQSEQLAQRSVDIMVATPGRLLDFYGSGKLKLNKVEIMVIDEADRMLDMGFIPDVRKIIRSTPPKGKRQTLLFSATLPDSILRLTSSWTSDPYRVDIEPEHIAVQSVDQQVFIVTRAKKFALLYNIITREELDRVLIFCTMRQTTRKLADKLYEYGINCAMLSGDVDQKQRIQRLEDFRNGKYKALVATDVAGRGIHVDGISHVINYTLPQDPEDYVHRIGRTGRAGLTGVSISFADEEDAHQIPVIQAFMGQDIPCTQPDEAWLELPKPTNAPRKSRAPQNRNNRSNSGRGGQGRRRQHNNNKSSSSGGR